jgi:hypothetical protein
MDFIAPPDVLRTVQVLEAATGQALNCDERRLYAAISVFRHLFGDAWINSRLNKPKGPGALFHRPIEREQDGYKLADRLVSLAEHILNLQEVEGFQFVVEELRTDSLEAGLGKLFAASIIQQRNLPLEFVVPSGRLGEDYDAQSIIGATPVPIEMKAKVESTVPSADTVADSLERARDQLPKNAPALVFLRVPGNWSETEEGQTAIMEGLSKEFRRSGSIAVVAVHWETWRGTPTFADGAIRGTRKLVAPNPNAHVKLEGLLTALLRDPGSEVPWLSLEELLCSDLPWPADLPTRPESGAH